MKNIFKKITSLALVFVLACGVLAGCGSKENAAAAATVRLMTSSKSALFST